MTSPNPEQTADAVRTAVALISLTATGQDADVLSVLATTDPRERGRVFAATLRLATTFGLRVLAERGVPLDDAPTLLRHLCLDVAATNLTDPTGDPA